MNEWKMWKRQAEARNREKAPKPIRSEEKVEAVKKPISEDQILKVRRLARVNLRTSGMDRRFVDQLTDATTETMITERQGWYIEVLWYRYRRQLGHKGSKPEGYV